MLGPGDMLYLPSCHAHNGIAVDECMTCSVGFRAPSTQEIATPFLVWLQDRLELPGISADPELSLPAHPGELGPAMLQQLGGMVGAIHWNDADIRDFAGCDLTEPKAHVFFAPPRACPDFRGFAGRLPGEGCGLRLNPCCCSAEIASI